MDLGPPSGRGKRPLDAQINLVPFIDLMAVTISFLIMTAVWNQAGRIEVASAGGAPTTEGTPPPVPITLALTAAGVSVSVAGKASDPSPLTTLDALDARLADVRAALPDQRSVTVVAEDGVRYDDLVRVIDHCLGAGLTGVQVSPTG
jgi:biopolymer transport protein ExbD